MSTSLLNERLTMRRLGASVIEPRSKIPLFVSVSSSTSVRAEVNVLLRIS